MSLNFIDQFSAYLEIVELVLRGMLKVVEKVLVVLKTGEMMETEKERGKNLVQL